MLSTIDFLTLTNEFSHFYSQQISQAAAVYQLSKVEADVLLFFHNNPVYDTARDVVEYRHIAKSYVSKAVDLLVKRGFLLAEEDSKDRRVSRLKILPAASPALQALLDAQNTVFTVLFGGISSQEWELFEKILFKISSNVKENEKI